jgi:hypothetical protein
MATSPEPPAAPSGPFSTRAATAGTATAGTATAAGPPVGHHDRPAPRARGAPPIRPSSSAPRAGLLDDVTRDLCALAHEPRRPRGRPRAHVMLLIVARHSARRSEGISPLRYHGRHHVGRRRLEATPATRWPPHRLPRPIRRVNNALATPTRRMGSVSNGSSRRARASSATVGRAVRLARASVWCPCVQPVLVWLPSRGTPTTPSIASPLANRRRATTSWTH